jgi:hypothetical protein
VYTYQHNGEPPEYPCLVRSHFWDDPNGPYNYDHSFLTRADVEALLAMFQETPATRTPPADDVMKQVVAYIAERQPVFLFYNNDTGDWQWAVAVVAVPDFWLDAFPTEGEARAFCAKHQLPIETSKYGWIGDPTRSQR